MKDLRLQLEAWRARMREITLDLERNPHRTSRDSGPDGHFRLGFFIPGVRREDLDLAFGKNK
jgi:hypothetical protein